MKGGLVVALAVVSALTLATPARAQDGPPPAAPSPPPSPKPGLWLAAGGGGVLARGHCGSCDREGVFLYSPGVLINAGIEITPRVDAGIEVSFVSSRIEKLDPTRTTFVLGVGQFRPWVDRGFSLRAGMGIGFVGNGIYNPTQRNLEPPFTTNAVALVIGLGWEFMRAERARFQFLATHHVVALGELTTVDGGSLKNVVGNYWLVGGALVIR